MVTQIIHLFVKDFAHWKSIHDSMHFVQEEHGLAKGHISVDPNDGNSITLILEWKDAAQMQAYFQLDAVKDALQRADITKPPVIQVLQTI